ncbi:MAG: Gfo/Idh/MocA family oxidoreductase [Bacteroidia bacterium]|nr:Gfo/Idh/MocA family oxidoreductase [Bacteroidia bacterium]
MEGQTLNWGILSTGNIAHQFVQDLALLNGHKISAVASRSQAKATAFADQYSIPKFFSDYHSLFNDEDVDIIYVATPHNSHMEWSLAAMEAGKHVLCEKPLAINSRQVQQMVQKSREKGVFFMEALWSRFNPSILAALEMVANGELGEINYIKADFSFFIEEDRHERLMNPELGGGSLLEMGIYPVFLAYLFLGMPEEIKAIGQLHPNKCDWQSLISMKFKNGIASAMSGFLSQSDMQANICGTKGSIMLHPIWHESQGFEFLQSGKTKTFIYPTRGKGFTGEAMACKKAIDQAWIEHPNWTHQNSLDLMSIMDEIRKQIGIHYPIE